MVNVITNELLRGFSHPAMILSVSNGKVTQNSTEDVPNFGVFGYFSCTGRIVIGCNNRRYTNNLALGRDGVTQFERLYTRCTLGGGPDVPRLAVATSGLLGRSSVAITGIVSLHHLRPCNTSGTRPVFTLSKTMVATVVPLGGNSRAGLRLGCRNIGLETLVFKAGATRLPCGRNRTVSVVTALSIGSCGNAEDIDLEVARDHLRNLGRSEFFTTGSTCRTFGQKSGRDERILTGNGPAQTRLITMCGCLVSLGQPIARRGLCRHIMNRRVGTFGLSIVVSTFYRANLTRGVPSRKMVELMAPGREMTVRSSRALGGLELRVRG